jgi:predicted permease
MPFHDLRIAIRHLLKSPGFTATAVLMLALGIGATTAIFSIVEGVLLRPLPFPHPQRLVQLGDIIQGADVGGNGEAGVTAPDIKAYTRDTHSFESLGGYQPTGFELSGIGEPAPVNATRLSGGVFPALEVAPLMGRFFTQQEDDQQVQVAVISYSLWQNRLHADPRVLGTKILLDRKPYEVIGVMPRNFEFPLVPGHQNISALWVPMSFTKTELSEGGASSWNFTMVGRLKPGITLYAGGERCRARGPGDDAQLSLLPWRVCTYTRWCARCTRKPWSRPVNWCARLFLAIVVVLLIACANLAGLLLVRAIRRRREIAVRLALGARAGVLLRQAILESLVLSVSRRRARPGPGRSRVARGRELLARDAASRIDEISLDWQVVLFATHPRRPYRLRLRTRSGFCRPADQRE